MTSPYKLMGTSGKTTAFKVFVNRPHQVTGIEPTGLAREPSSQDLAMFTKMGTAS